MNKRFVAALYFLMLIVGVYFLERQRIDNVPNPDDITTLSIEGNGESVEIYDLYIISVILEDIEQAKNTLRSSDKDQPSVDSYWTLEFQNASGTTNTYHFYESRWFSYIEQPYGGIYTVDSNTLLNLPQIVEVWGRGY